MRKEILKPWILLALFVSSIVGASVIELSRSHEARVQAMYKEADLSGHLVSEWIEKSLTGVRALLKDSLFEIDELSILSCTVGESESDVRNKMISYKESQYEDIIFLGIFDSDCVIQYGSIDSIVGESSRALDREYCHEAQLPPFGLKFSDLFLSSTGRLNVSATYPALSDDNQFFGFALAALDLSFFQKWLESIENPAIAISIIDMNQNLLARKPESGDIGDRIRDARLASFVQSDLESSTFRHNSPVDGIERLWSLRKTGDFPFVVAVGYEVDDALAPWKVKLIAYSIGNFLLIVLSVFLAMAYQKNLVSATAMRKLAMNDALTGLMNRRSFEEIARIRFKESQEIARSDMVIMIDIDHFKDINDQYGHDAGDQTLKEVARVIRVNFRSSDLVCRWGGEEFLVYLTDIDESDAKRLAENIRAKVATEVQGGKGGVTVSQGIASASSHDSYEQMVKAADERLYQAKNEGRNRVCPA